MSLKDILGYNIIEVGVHQEGGDGEHGQIRDHLALSDTEQLIKCAN